MKPTQGTVRSKDGTSIAYERSGHGPAVILVAAALSDRSDTAKLARLLSDRFTVINYDRRGRGASGDTPPYSIEREVEDVGALIHEAGGEAVLFGSSSGAVLAIEAANQLGLKVRKAALYEPPFIIDSSRPPMSADFARDVDDLLRAGRRNDVVKLMMTRGMGIPAFAVFLMRWLMPGWSKMVGMAHTLPYDLRILEGTQTGVPLPTSRWRNVVCPTLVLTGGKSEPFFHSGAEALAGLLPAAEHRVLEGHHHGSVVMAPKSFAALLGDFFNS